MAKVLIVGGGAREHALAWKFSRSPQVDRVYVSPGNAGMADVAEVVGISEMDFPALTAFAKKECISLTVIGPETPLMSGISDAFAAENLLVFGPTSNAAVIEGSKSFTKDLMKRHGIPTAKYEIFNDYCAARQYLEKSEPPYVIKADGLAQGKGVFITESMDEARNILFDLLETARFGEASKTVLIEEFLDGIEYSFMAFVHGEKVYPMPIAKDHKRAFDGNKGPNTGGMGAYSPVPYITDEEINISFNTIMRKAAQAMVVYKKSFTGFLYGGLISTADGPKVIEFNARMGDPEAQVILPLLESDLYTVITDILAGRTPVITWSEHHCIGVVMASKGYPGNYAIGFTVSGFEKLSGDTMQFHAGTAKRGDKFITKGGRVLYLGRKAGNIVDAREKLYEEVRKIKCDNLFYRSDIGRILK
jgi:phosphoribosylamine--glycine ligase